MNYDVQSDIQRWVMGMYTDGFSWDYIVEEGVEMWGNDASEEEIIDFIWDIKDELE